VIIGHEATRKVVRIAPRYEWKGVWWDEKGGLLEIDALNHFTHYRFLPALDGSFYGSGFGPLLLHGNEFCNTLFNQIVDAGTKSNLGGGFVSSGAKVPAGVYALKNGEWRTIPFFGENFRNNFFPLPDKGPSPVSFQTLDLLLGLMEKLASQSDIMAGANPPRDQPATTTLALLEQGMKVFTRVFARINAGLSDEFRKVMAINLDTMENETYQTITDDPEGFVAVDFTMADKDVVPVSDGEDVTDTQRLLKSEALLQFMDPYNEREIKRRRLEAIGITDVDKIIAPEGWQPPPNPELELKAQEIALREREVKVMESKAQQELLKIRADAVLALAKAESAEAGVQNEQYAQEVEGLRVQIEATNAIAEAVNAAGAAGEQGGDGGMGAAGDAGAVPALEVGPGDAALPGPMGEGGAVGEVPIGGSPVGY
jgi:chaperonin GroES